VSDQEQLALWKSYKKEKEGNVSLSSAVPNSIEREMLKRAKQKKTAEDEEDTAAHDAVAAQAVADAAVAAQALEMPPSLLRQSQTLHKTKIQNLQLE
jgi:hypothetical protein